MIVLNDRDQPVCSYCGRLAVIVDEPTESGSHWYQCPDPSQFHCPSLKVPIGI